MLQPVAGGGVGLEPRVGDRYFVIDTAIRSAAPTFCRTYRGRRCPVCHLRVAQHGFVSHVNRCIAGFNAGTAERSPMGADSRGVWADVLVSSGEPVLIGDMLRVMKLVDATYAELGHHVSLRPRHRGKILGFGRNPETGGRFGPPGAFHKLIEKVEDFARDVMRCQIVRVCEQWIRALKTNAAALSQDTCNNAAWSQGLPWPWFEGFGASTLYCMWNYSGIDWHDLLIAIICRLGPSRWPRCPNFLLVPRWDAAPSATKRANRARIASESLRRRTNR